MNSIQDSIDNPGRQDQATNRSFTPARQALHKTEQRLAFLLQLSDALRALADPIAIQQTVTQTTRAFFGADRCYYSLVEDGKAIIHRDASRLDMPSVIGEYPLSQFPFFKTLVDVGKDRVKPAVQCLQVYVQGPD